MHSPRKILAPICALLFILTLWQVLCNRPDASLPSRIKVFQDTCNLIFTPFFASGGIDKGLFGQILASLQRVAVGYSLAAIVGIGLGILIGSNSFMYDAVNPFLQMLRFIPPLAWLPLALITFEQANPSAIFVIFITAIWPITINTTVGVQKFTQVQHSSRDRYFWATMFSEVVPYIFTGLRIGIGLSWLEIVAIEMLVGGDGIGFFIWDSYNSSQLSEIIIALIYVGIVGLILDRLVAWIASIVIPLKDL